MSAYITGRCSHIPATKKTEHLQSSSGLSTIVQNHSTIIDLIKLTKYTDRFPHLLVQATADSVSKGFLANGKRRPTQNTMFADYNMLAEI